MPAAEFYEISAMSIMKTGDNAKEGYAKAV